MGNLIGDGNHLLRADFVAADAWDKKFLRGLLRWMRVPRRVSVETNPGDGIRPATGAP
jgi:hypothetical protein